MICPRCNKKFNAYPASSRIDNSDICPMCGHKEALQIAAEKGAISLKEVEEITKLLEEINVT